MSGSPGSRRVLLKMNAASQSRRDFYFFYIFYIFISLFSKRQQSGPSPRPARNFLDSLHIKSGRVTLLFINHRSGGGTSH